MTAARVVGVRLPNWLGDVVMATPALRAVRVANPGALVVAFCRQGHVPFVQRLPTVDHVVGLPATRGLDRLLGGSESAAFRAAAPDVLLLLPAGLGTALAAWRAGIRSRVGFARNGRSPFLTHALAGHRERAVGPTPRLYLDVAEAAGAPMCGPEYDVPIDDADRAAAAALRERLGLRAGAPYVVLNPGSAGAAGKALSAGRAAGLAAALRRASGREVLVHVGPADKGLGAAIRERAGPGVVATDGDPPDLPTLVGVLAAADLVVTTDSGPRHVAVGLGRPVVAVLGPIPGRLSEWNLERSVVLGAPSGRADDVPDPPILQAVERLVPRSV